MIHQVEHHITRLSIYKLEDRCPPDRILEPNFWSLLHACPVINLEITDRYAELVHVVLGYIHSLVQALDRRVLFAIYRERVCHQCEKSFGKRQNAYLCLGNDTKWQIFTKYNRVLTNEVALTKLCEYSWISQLVEHFKFDNTINYEINIGAFFATSQDLRTRLINLLFHVELHFFKETVAMSLKIVYLFEKKNFEFNPIVIVLQCIIF